MELHTIKFIIENKIHYRTPKNVYFLQGTLKFTLKSLNFHGFYKTL